MAEENAKSPKAERRDVLLWAAANGRSDLISYAIEEEKKDPEGNVPDLLAARQPESRMTALHLACQGGFVDVVRVLLNRDAPTDLLDANDCSAHDIAKKSKSAASLIGAFEAELFKRVASGDTNGTAALLLGRVSPKCEQGGYSLSGWAELFEQFELASKITQIINGEISAEALVPKPPPVHVDASISLTEAASVMPSPNVSAEAQVPVDVPEGTVQAQIAQAAEQISSEDDEWKSWREKALTVFPLLWPAGRSCANWADPEASSCSLPLQRILKVSVPAELDPTGCEELMQMLSVIMRQCIAGCSVKALGGEPGPRVVPCTDSSLTVDGSDAPKVLLLLETRSFPQRAFQISLLPESGTDGAGSLVEISAGCLSGFKLAFEALRQILVHHAELQLDSGVLSIPAGSLEESVDFPDASALFLDFWQLSPEVAMEVVARMRSWRVSELYVSVPTDGSVCDSTADGILHLVHMRRACLAAGIELTPVLQFSLSSHAADGSRWQSSVAQLLSVLGSLRQIGVRFTGQAQNGDADKLNEDLMLPILQEVRALARGHATTNLICWLPACSPSLLRGFCSKVRRQTSCRGQTRVALEVDVGGATRSGAAPALHAIGPAALTVRSFGLPYSVFASFASTSPTERLPMVVWPGEGVRAHASAVGSVLAASREVGARGCIIEVPVHSPPWCGRGTRFPALWCGLTALFGSSLGDPVTVLSVLEDPERHTSARGGSLGQLLAAQLLGAPCGKKEVLNSSSAFARLLWDSPTQARSSNGGPAATFLPTLLRLLQGFFEIREAKQRLVINANAWYQHLTERQQQLIAGEQDLANYSGAWVETAKSLLKMALQGVDWLRFLCRLLLVMVKHIPEDRLQDPTWQGVGGMRKALKHLPPAKCSDMRNKFLSLIEQTTTASGGEALASMAPEALWRSGVRLMQFRLGQGGEVTTEFLRNSAAFARTCHEAEDHRELSGCGLGSRQLLPLEMAASYLLAQQIPFQLQHQLCKHCLLILGSILGVRRKKQSGEIRE